MNELKMNIAFIRLYRSKDISGKFYNLQEAGLAKAFLKQGNVSVSIFILSERTGEISEEIIQEGITLYVVPAKGIGHHGKFDCTLLKKLSIDVVHLQSDNMLFAPKVIRYCLKNHIRCHNYIGTLYSDSHSKLKKMLMATVSHRNCRWYKKIPTFAKTPYVEKQLKGLGVKNTKLAPVGLDLSVVPEVARNKVTIREKLKLPQEKQLVLFVGKLEAYKNPLAAVDVIEKLPEDYQLIMIGEGSLGEVIDREVKKRNLFEKVKRIGKVFNTKVHEYYRACDIYINLNPDEIYGMSILEAMYQKIPVFAIYAPGPDFILKDGISGFLCNTPNEMSRRIQETKEQRKGIGEAAREEIINNFQWDKTADIIRYW